MEERRPENIALLEQYLAELRETGPLTETEKVTLPPLLKEKDSYALNRMVNAYLPYVEEIAQEYVDLNFWRTMPELIHEGNYALLEAVKAFDWDRPDAFTAYAYNRICDAIENYLLEYHMSMELDEEENEEFIFFPINAWKRSNVIPDPDYVEKLRSMSGTGTDSNEVRKYLMRNGVTFHDREWQAVILRLGLDDNVPFCRKDVCIATGLPMSQAERIDHMLAEPIRHLLYLEKRRKFLKK